MLTAIVSGGAGVVACGLAGLYMYTRLTRGVCKATTDLSGKTAIVTGANTGGENFNASAFVKLYSSTPVFKTNDLPVAPGDQKLGWTS